MAATFFDMGTPPNCAGGSVAGVGSRFLPEMESAVCEAIERGQSHLRRCVRAGDYGLSCLGSDGTPRFSHNKGHVFAGYFLATALGDHLPEIERALLITRILSEERDGLWGYSPAGPHVDAATLPFIVDADDTAFVIRTCRQLGLSRSSACLLKFYQSGSRTAGLVSNLRSQLGSAVRNWSRRPNSRPRIPEVGGTFVTFASSNRGRMVLERCPENNLQCHPEVNLNVFLALRDTEFENHIDFNLIQDLQHADGYWHSYFYPSRYYAIWLAFELIRDRPQLATNVKRGVRFLIDSQHSDGSWGDSGNPYETALAMISLNCVQMGRDAVFRGLTYLLQTQQGHGAWTSDSPVWQFYADADDVWTAFDTNQILTTSLAVRALKTATDIAASDELRQHGLNHDRLARNRECVQGI